MNDDSKDDVDHEHDDDDDDEAKNCRRRRSVSRSTIIENETRGIITTAAVEDDTGWLLTRDQMPEWARNASIQGGYRPIRASIQYCCATTFRLHNETGNIWTHLLGIALFAALRRSTLGRYCDSSSPPLQPSSSNEFQHFDFSCDPRIRIGDQILLNLFFIGAISCFAASSALHIFNCYSREVARRLSKFDYAGITLLIACSFIPWLRYAWFDSPILCATYITAAVIAAIGCISASLCDRFAEPRYQRYRAALFLVDGLSGVVPFAHWVAIGVRRSGWHHFCVERNHRPTLLLITMAFAYCAGGALYGLRWPECVAPPGRFDYCLNSHQLLHVLVIVGALLYYHSITQFIAIQLIDPGYYSN